MSNYLKVALVPNIYNRVNLLGVLWYGSIQVPIRYTKGMIESTKDTDGR